MPTTVTLTIDAPDAILTLTEPEAKTLAQPVAPNTDLTVTVGAYVNHGNVVQAVGVADITDVTNCTIVGYRWTANNTQYESGTFDLAPDTQATLQVFIHTADFPIGAPDTAATFTVNVTHEQAA